MGDHESKAEMTLPRQLTLVTNWMPISKEVTKMLAGINKFDNEYNEFAKPLADSILQGNLTSSLTKSIYEKATEVKNRPAMWQHMVCIS